MTLVQIIMRQDDKETLTGFYTEIKFTLIKYLYYKFILYIVIGCFNRKLYKGKTWRLVHL